MEVATDKLERDLDAATQTSTTLPSENVAVGVALRRFRAVSQLRVALPLTQLDEAHEEMGTFIQFHLQELRSPQETKNLIGELSPGLQAIGAECVSCCVVNLSGIPRSLHSSWLVWQQTGPSKAISSPASWRDYWGALAWLPQWRVILPSPPVRALATHGPQQYIEQSPKPNRRRLRHQKWWGCLPTWTSSTKRAYSINRHLLPPIFSDPLFLPNMAKAVFRVAKPLVVSQALPAAHSHEVSSDPPQPGGDGPEQQVLKSEESVPSTSQSTPEVQEQFSEASSTDSDRADEPPPEKEPPRRSLKVRLPLKLLKCGHQATANGSKDGVTPSKVCKEPEADEAGVGIPTGPSEAALQKAQFELFQKDLPVVQEVRAQILELKEGEEITQQVLDSSPAFHLRRAANESRAPSIIGDHWIDHLDAGGHIAKCKPHNFKFNDEWLPLYTRAGITRHMSGLSSLLKTQGDSPLIAVMLPDMLFRLDREYVIHKLHEEDCLSCVTIYYGENLRKQIAFCPYCGVMNENTATAYSHVRKHLGITFLCGGCYTKLYRAPQHLSQHMKTCPPCCMNRPEGSRRSVRRK